MARPLRVVCVIIWLSLVLISLALWARSGIIVDSAWVINDSGRLWCCQSENGSLKLWTLTYCGAPPEAAWLSNRERGQELGPQLYYFSGDVRRRSALGMSLATGSADLFAILRHPTPLITVLSGRTTFRNPWYGLTRRFWLVMLPIWMPAALCASPALLWLPRVHRLWIKRGRRHRGLCLTCGYDLRSGHERCPECGTPDPSPLRVESP
jgi:hypothetical protein